MNPVPQERVPVVSVVVPALDAAGTLGAQLGALAVQVVSVPFEVLVCDNGSSDGTEAVVRSWAAGGAGGVVPSWVALRFVDASVVRGPGAARNVGAGVARGGLLLFCDADDVVGEGWVAAMVDGLAEHDLVAGLLDAERLNRANRASVTWSETGRIVLPFWPELTVAGSGNMGVRTDVFRELGGFDEGLRTCEDVDLCLRAQLSGHDLRHVDDAVVFVRKRDGLRAVLRQARSYAEGSVRIEARYADRAAAYRRRAAVAPPGPRASAAGPPATWAARVVPRVRTLARRVQRFRRPGDLADLAWRLGERQGRRRGERALRARTVPDGGAP